jgi:alpha-beta hydrolase superfamily lysophospholipase
MTEAASTAQQLSGDSETFALHLPTTSHAAGAQLHAHRWLPTGSPRAIILLAHGYAEHAGRYADVAGRFTGSGYGVYAVDHWGHGRSQGTQGYVPTFSIYLDGMQTLLARVASDFSDTPLFLIGHSMGGLIAARFLARHQQHFTAAALSGPALQAGKGPMPLTKIASRLLSRLTPHLGVMALDSDDISRDPALVARYRADPLVYRGRMSARLAAEMLREMSAAQRQAAAITLPLLIQHGSADRLTAPSGSQRFFRALGSANKQIKIYEGLYHEIYNEPEREEVLGDVIDWFDAHLPR